MNGHARFDRNCATRLNLLSSVVTNQQLPREARLKLAAQNVKFCLV